MTGRSVPKKMATPMAPMTTPARMHDAKCRDRSARRGPCRRRGRPCAATPNEPAITLSDLMMPKMPAVAMAPTPMYRT